MGRLKRLPVTLHVAVLLILVGPGSDLIGQEITIPGDLASCTTCRIELTPVVILDGRSADRVNEPFSLARDSRGWWYMSSMLDATAVLRFDSVGRFRGAIGRGGQGPGEYSFIRFLQVTEGDSLLVFDIGNRRMTTVTPTLDVVATRAIALGASQGLLRLPDGSMVTAEVIRSPERAGFPLHRIDTEGVLERSFGAENPEYRRSDDESLWRSLSNLHDGRFWSANLTEYRLDQWSVAGEHVRTLRRDVPWFRPHRDPGIDVEHPERPPRPGIMDVRIDPSGALWVNVRVADQEFHEGLGDIRGIYDRPMTGITDYVRYYDSRIEILDPQSGALIWFQTLDQPLRFVAGGDYAYWYEEDANGVPRIPIVKVMLRR
ncbi:MAG: hypothetical protein R3E98_12605 [Gemmatimonadota bacterium]